MIYALFQILLKLLAQHLQCFIVYSIPIITNTDLCYMI